MKPEAIPDYKMPDVVITKGTYDEPMSDFHGLPHYTIKCEGCTASVIGIDSTLAHFGMLMQECHRLRWIINQIDTHSGGFLVHDVIEKTQGNIERIPV